MKPTDFKVNINGRPYNITSHQYYKLRKSSAIRIRQGWYVTPTLYKYMKSQKLASYKPLFKV